MAKKKSEMEKSPVRLFRYLGRRFGSDLRDTFQELDAKTFEALDRFPGSWKVGRGEASFIIGAPYLIRCTDEYTIWLGSAELALARNEIPEPSDDDLTAWSFADKAARNDKQRVNAIKRQEKKARDAYLPILAELQTIYDKLGRYDRQAMVRVIGEELANNAPTKREHGPRIKR